MLVEPAVFPPAVRAGFSLREGGVSGAPFGSLNLGRSVGDAPDAVDENRRRFFGALGFDPDDAAVAGQVHGIAVRAVTTGGLYPGFDGLVTATPGVLLCITAADCAAVLLADAEAGVVGACHAGWRGTVGGIVGRTVAAMRTLGADPARTAAAVGPCISAAAFEVGPEVAQQFDPRFVAPGTDDRAFVDLKAALRDQLAAAGLDPSAVDVSDACTASAPDRYYSHRASGGRTGRMMGAIGLARRRA